MMHVHSFTNKSRVVIVGAIDNRIADFADEVVAKHHNTLFLCVGDIGLGRGARHFQDMELEYLDNVCRQRDNVFCTIRGDKDNPLYFDLVSRMSHLKSLNDYLKNIYFIEDYDIVSTCKGDFLCIGGGTDPYMPANVIPQDPKDFIGDGAPSNIWFKGHELYVPNFIPDKEIKKDEEGNEIEVDLNEFNNWIRMQRIDMIVGHIPAWGDISIKPNASDSREKAEQERIKLSELLLHIQMNYKIFPKTWFWSSCIDDWDPKEHDITVMTFIPMKSWPENSNFDTREIL